MARTKVVYQKTTIKAQCNQVDPHMKKRDDAYRFSNGRVFKEPVNRYPAYTEES